VVTLGRGEYLVALSGVTAVRDSFLVPVMIEHAGATRVGGAKRLNPLLSTCELTSASTSSERHDLASERLRR